MDAQRRWVRDHVPPHAQSTLDDWDGKLKLVNAILANRLIEPHETLKLQSLGIVLGDALAQVLDLEWIVVEDEIGRSPALMAAGTSIRIFPQTMISKRIERGETVDVFDLFSKTCRAVADARRDSRVE